MCEQHLDAFSVATRLLEGFGVSECAGGIASALVDAARDFALWRLWAAFRLERAKATVMGPCAIEDSHPIARLNEPSSRLDLSMTGMCGVIFFSSTIQWSVAADP